MEKHEKTVGHELNDDFNELMRIRREKAAMLAAKGIDPFGQKYDAEYATQDIIEKFDILEGKEVSLAGRIMALRGHGKTSFAHIMDMTGRVQVYFRQDLLGNEQYEILGLLDIGDIVGVRGNVFRTQKGEISVKVTSFALLAKSLRPLPEKWHGLKDVETRYRQRYLDLIVNADVRSAFIMRSKIVKAMRTYLEQQGFLEVETPMMHPIPGGAAAKPFITHHNALDMQLYMRIAPELYLKRLIVGGFEKVYELNRVFRNEGISTRHNPEFTIMELYQAYADVTDVMRIMEESAAYVAQEVLGTMKINYQGEEIDLTPPWNRISMIDAIKKYSGADFSGVGSLDEARRIADTIGVKYESKDAIGNIINSAFEEVAEEHLIQPTFITDYPIEVSPLAKRSKDNPTFTDRFEAFMFGREIANGFSELNDPIDQKERFEKQTMQRESGDDEAHMMDEDYIVALEYGLPPTGGLGIGIDRLVMFLTDSSSIRDVLLFPHMRHRD